jgi:hypothetical protein
MLVVLCRPQAARFASKPESSKDEPMRDAQLLSTALSLRTHRSLTRRLDLMLWSSFGQGGWLGGRRPLAQLGGMLRALLR